MILVFILTITSFPSRQFHNDIITKQIKLIERPVLASRSNVNRTDVYTATAYHMGTITSTGRKVKVGRTIAVDPNVIPYDSKVKVVCDEYPEVNGHYIAEDCGGAVQGKEIDIYVSSIEKAFDFGIREVKIKIIKEE